MHELHFSAGILVSRDEVDGKSSKNPDGLPHFEAYLPVHRQRTSALHPLARCRPVVHMQGGK